MTPSSRHSPEVVNEVSLAANQRLIWLGQQFRRDDPLYEVPYLYKFCGRIDATRLTNAIRELVADHEVLRFVASDRLWTQPRIREVREDECAFVDLSQHDEPGNAADQVVKSRLAGRFVATQSLFDATLIRVSDTHWRLLLMVHHALTDALGGKALLSNLSKYYSGPTDERSLPGPNLYRSYIETELELVDDPSFAKHRDWFNARSDVAVGSRFYSGAIATATSRQTRVVVSLGQDENAAINRLARAKPFRQITDSLSHFNVLTTALFAWLNRLEQRNLICIGATTHGRSSPTNRETPGLFMQLLPFLATIEPEETFETLSRKIAVESMGFLAHSQPGVMTAESQRAFDVAFNLINLNVGEFCGIPTTMDWLHNEFGDPERKLTISAHQRTGDGWELLFDFCDVAFPAADREKAIRHFRQTLSAMDMDPTAPLSSYDMLTETDRFFLSTHSGSRSASNATDLWSRFEAVCEQRGEATAVCGPSMQSTYAGLRKLALDLASQIESLRCGDVIPLLCRRDEKAVIAMLGIMASRRCFLIVDADTPLERRDQMLRQSGESVGLDATGDAITSLDLRSTDGRATIGRSNDLVKGACYVLFTSGSTGKPNGVVVGNESLWNLLSALETLAPLTQGARCSWWTSVGFDVAMYEVWSALLFGRELCIPSELQRMDAELMLQWLRAENIASAYLPPFFLESMDKTLSRGQSIDLRRLLVGVEPIPHRLLASIVGQLPELNLINGYGPTETTICATLHRIDSHQVCDGIASIGRPVAGNLIRVVDVNGGQVPPGVPGELWVGGVGLAKGYLENPDLTSKRFVSDPSASSSELWYRSGDFVRLLDDGNLQFIGRVDEQIKISGVRVEPGEIASVVRLCEGVDDCCVLPNVVDGRIASLIAFVEPCGELDIDQVRTELRRRLPAAMIPSRFLVQRPLPRNSNGKVDRLALKRILLEKIGAEGLKSMSPSEQAHNPIEFTLLSLAREVMALPSLGLRDDFFEHGGSSLDAMNLVLKANHVGIDIAVHDVFIRRNVSELSRSLFHDPTPNVVGFDQTADKKFSWGQQAIWHHSQNHPDSHAYHYQVLWSCNGRLDLGRLTGCFDRICERHSALRTTVDVVNGSPAPVIHDCLPPAVEMLDREATKDEIVAHGKKAFDLKLDSPVRVLMVRSPRGGDQVAITFHHFAVDQHSVARIMQEFADLYSAEAWDTAEQSVGSPLRPQSKTQQRDLTPFAWWQGWLEGCDRTITLPVDFDSPIESERGELIQFSLPEKLCESIRDAAARCGVSVGTVLLGSHICLLSRYSGSDQFTIGIPVNLRSGLHSGDDVGYAIEALPYACRVDGDATFKRWLRKLHDDFASFLEHSLTSPDELHQKMGPMFDTMFVMQDAQRSIDLSGGLELKPELMNLGAAKYDLSWFAAESPSGIHCAVEYRTNRFRRDTVELMVEHWKSILKIIGGDSGQPVARVDFRTQVDHDAEEALAGDQTEKRVGDQVRCVTEVVDSKSSVWSDAVAIQCDGRSLTYSELIVRANELATELRSTGARKGALVALCLPRSMEMVIGILGILKAGAAYVPMDPHQPVSRTQQSAASLGIETVVGWGDDLANNFHRVIDPRIRTGISGDSFETMASDPDSLAYVLQTSGSTGQPKGVEISRRSLLLSTLARHDYYDSHPERFLMVSPPWFDSSVAGIFWTLSCGGTLIIPTDEQLKDIRSIEVLIEETGATETLMLPTLYRILLTHANPSRIESLRTVIVAGEACPKSVVKKHFCVLPEARLFNEYGPTEASVWATATELHARDEIVSIGCSVAGTPVCLMGKNAAAVPVGGIGEILIGGTRLAVGYWNDPIQTEQKFATDVRDGVSGRFYRTGDLARLRRDGSLLYMGRMDEQIKVNGGRVEPAEIEAALLEIEGVNDAGVALIERSPNIEIANAKEVIAALAGLPKDQAERLLGQAENLGDRKTDTVSVENGRVRVSIEMIDDTCIVTPRPRQRKWLLDQALRESIANLDALDQLSKRMVPGSESPHLPRDLSTDQLTPQEIMEDWQTPLMQAMADWACESNGDVLEIGFGRGVASTMIQNNRVKTHTVVEMNPHSINDHFVPWRSKYADSEIRLVAGRWQDVFDQLDCYDSVFFHAFPMNETEFVEYVVDSATFAEHFFSFASQLLRPGGVFTYLTTEIDSLSRRHQRSLMHHFDEIQMKVQPLVVPADTKDAWWADSMVVVRAIK